MPPAKNGRARAGCGEGPEERAPPQSLQLQARSASDLQARARDTPPPTVPGQELPPGAPLVAGMAFRTRPGPSAEPPPDSTNYSHCFKHI